MGSAYLSGYDSRLIRLELNRITELLRRLGDPQNALCFLHGAGTNGKGSTCACLASILTAAGYTTGLFTSPALGDFSERIMVNGTPIEKNALAALTDRVNAAGAEMNDPPTEFEAATAIALLYFKEMECNLAVMEVGLGGGGDATNVVPPPEVCFFSAMGLDHTGILGNTLEDIAHAKGGILKEGARAVSYGNQPRCETVFSSLCWAKSIPYTRMDISRLSQPQLSLKGSRFALAPYGEITLPLLGEYQAYNALLAVTAVEELRKKGWLIPDKAIIKGLSTVRWPGRLELLRREPVFLLDGAHNPQGLSAALESIKKLLPGQKPVILLGVMADKEVDAMARMLLPAASSFVTVTPDNPRAMRADALADLLRGLGGDALPCSTIEEGVRLAAKLAGRNGAVCALGTLYFSSQVRCAVENLT